jgi:hypothetical protein
LACSFALSFALAGCPDVEPLNSSEAPKAPEASLSSLDPVARDSAPEDRQAFFGDLHVHSSWSLDAFGAGVRMGPEQAYRYALGKPIPHLGGKEIQLAGPPLDFMALTDHAEYLGVVQATSALNHPLHALPLIQAWFGSNEKASARAWQRITTSFARRQAIPALATNAIVQPAWQALIDLANKHDRPGVFTAFIGYEYSSNPRFQNLHRNVIFRGAEAPPRPFSSMDSQNPEDLWDWMDRVRSGYGQDLLAIPHNSNGSNGLMFARSQTNGRPLDRAWAEQRARNEPIVEVMQIKGQSETLPVLSPEDEWAAFEMAPWRTLNPALTSQPAGSYVRDALKTGLLLNEQLGVNPYALGMIGSTDGHNAASPFEESNYTGKIGVGDATAARRLSRRKSTKPPFESSPNIASYWSAAGLAGIWAEANTRRDLFDALRRREAFSTSGPRIRVRLFGGWDFTSEDLAQEISRVGYQRGSPMGGTLPPRPTKSAPRFLAAALKDPLEADLERMQIIKGWAENGVAKEQVFDIACPNGASPDPERHRCPDSAAPPGRTSCTPDAETGSKSLRAWWHDPTFKAAQRAFYYVRVLQVPTCRWSTWDALGLGQEPDETLSRHIQERAITSPIWYEPQ